jgi:hypothetical protein
VPPACRSRRGGQRHWRPCAPFSSGGLYPVGLKGRSRARHGDSGVPAALIAKDFDYQIGKPFITLAINRQR